MTPPDAAAREADKARLEAKCEPEPMSGCWIWLGVKNHMGYGRASYENRDLNAHRVAWLVYRGPIPDGYEVDHLCRNRACINPDHLEPVTRAENNARSNSASSLAAKKTHCIRGHEFDSVRAATGGRACKACYRHYYYARKLLRA